MYAIDVVARRGYMNMMARGYPSVSSRPQLGLRALELPTILVTNQHSLSDAEDFTEGYRTLKLGKVVGEPTAGWIILHRRRHADRRIGAAHAGLENLRERRHADGNASARGRRPGHAAGGESYTGKDSQLDAAVAELLKQIGAAPAKSTAGR